ncbi:unnamed protein product [Tilletia controversa]|uniref:Uncharacterized protein n=1 Tax=Tilletia caries TaxID=13290 RepID=A0A177U2R8_9BASI|nr:hypothetical protein CF336_g6260 [Tilletia laevis]KAE8252866.1 hypothetical protein A4X03_0g6050 [Tilletia caries]CAD6917034.1 unnamed protein product [Tilletia controversa]KAE8191528.1 hypothetical protein CF335_g6061 [Tilletia laevis]CAD6888982.1 unnamed protein product [Tilletia caries]
MLSRTLTVKENEPQISALGDHDLVLGQQVESSNGHVHVNVIWKVRSLAPQMSVIWQAKYALQWTQELPGNGEQILYNGADWQPCEPGEAFELNSHGFWVSSSRATPDYITIGSNNYKHGVHIIIGLFNSHIDNYEPVFVDPEQILPRGQGAYRPRNRAVLWFQIEAEPSAYSSKDYGASGEVDTSAPNVHTETHSWTGTYDPRSGSWSGNIHNVTKPHGTKNDD